MVLPEYIRSAAPPCTYECTYNMLICSGIYKTPICLRNFGPVAEGQDWLLSQCRAFEKKQVPLYLKFQHGEYVRLLHEETLLMAVEMVFSYYVASLDPRDAPEWMEDMDKVWAEHYTDDDEEEEEESMSDDYYWDQFE
jgi:hypothetical protein